MKIEKIVCNVICCFLMIIPLAAIAEIDMAREPVIWNFSPEAYNAHHHNWAAIQDERGLMYFGNNQGILEFDATFWRYIYLPNGSAVYASAKNPEGRIYFGGNGELGFIAPDESGAVRYISMLDLLPAEYRASVGRVFQILPFNNKIAFLTDKTLYILENEKFEIIQSQDTFFSAVVADDNLYVVDGNIGLTKLENQLVSVSGGQYIRSYAMIPHNANKILIATTNRELITFDPIAETFSQLKLEDNSCLGFDIISGAQLGEKHFALGTVRGGCFVFDIDGKCIFQFNTENGILSNDIYNIFKDVDDNLWLATYNGISLIHIPYKGVALKNEHTEKEQKLEFPFTTFIRSCQSTINDSMIFGGAFYEFVNGVPVLKQTEQQFLKFHYEYNSFRFTYSANDFDNYGKIEYQTFMEGADKDWSSWSDRTFVEYRNLPWGNFTFHVRARVPDGTLSESAEYSFKIIAPWFRSTWFLMAQIGSMFVLLGIAWYLNYKQKSLSVAQKLIGIVLFITTEAGIELANPFIGKVVMEITFFNLMIWAMVGMFINPILEFIQRKFNDAYKDKNGKTDQKKTK
ncbi:triple tyrosine motif-containing protein [Candidatus Cloacimonadota bacterium]